MLISRIYVISSSSFLMCPISSIFRVTYIYFELFVHGASYVVQICYRIEMLQLLS